jgi:hypothetical protein
MIQYQTTDSTAELCNRLLADPEVDGPLRSLARQVLAFVDSVRHDGATDPFYEDCIRHLALDLSGPPH